MSDRVIEPEGRRASSKKRTGRRDTKKERDATEDEIAGE